MIPIELLNRTVNDEVADVLQPGVLSDGAPPRFFPSMLGIYLRFRSGWYLRCGTADEVSGLRIQMLSEVTEPTHAPEIANEFAVASLYEIFVTDSFARPCISGIRWITQSGSLNDCAILAIEFEFERIRALSVASQQGGIQLGGVDAYQYWLAHQSRRSDWNEHFWEP